MTDWLIVAGALAALVIAGAPAADAFVPRLGLVERVALSLWLGFAGVTLSLLLIGFVVDFSRGAAAAAGVLTFAAGVAARRMLGPPPSSPREPPVAGLFTPGIDRLIEWAAIAGVAVVVLQLLLTSAESYIFTYDFFATWGLDTKLFFLRHAVDFSGLRLSRAYYPAAAPMGHLWFDLWLGKLGDRYLSVPLAVEASALVVLTRLMLVRLGVGRALAAALTFFFCAGSGAFLFSAISGYGDLPIAAGLSIAVGAAAVWLRSGDVRWLSLSGVGSGLAVWSKYEGLPSVGLIAVALVVAWYAQGRHASDLRALAGWVGVVLLFSVPWYALVWFRHLGAGNHAGGYFHPYWIVKHVTRALLEPSDWGVWWAGAIALALATAPLWLRGPLWARWLGLLVGVELVAVLSAYAVAAHPAASGHVYVGQVSVPVPRLYFHWMVSLVLVVGTGLQAALARASPERLADAGLPAREVRDVESSV
jgi:hypothetical protein